MAIADEGDGQNVSVGGGSARRIPPSTVAFWVPSPGSPSGAQTVPSGIARCASGEASVKTQVSAAPGARQALRPWGSRATERRCDEDMNEIGVDLRSDHQIKDGEPIVTAAPTGNPFHTIAPLLLRQGECSVVERTFLGHRTKDCRDCSLVSRSASANPPGKGPRHGGALALSNVAGKSPPRATAPTRARVAMSRWTLALKSSQPFEPGSTRPHSCGGTYFSK